MPPASRAPAVPAPSPPGLVPAGGPRAASALGEEHLSARVIWAYSLPRVGFGIMGLLFATYLMKFATDVLLIAPAAMGTLIAASRLWDAVSDPMAGHLSDRTRSRFGRRRVWLFASAIPMGAGLVMIWAPPYALAGAGLIVWMGVALLVYETASTAFFIPHGALGVELTTSYHERTRLFGWSHMIGALGMGLGLAALQLMNGAADKRAAALGLSIAAGTSVAAIVIWSTRRLREREDYQGRGSPRVLRSLLDVFRNPHARLLLIVFAVETFGAASIGMLTPYLVEYVVPMKAMLVPLLVTYTIPQFALTPLWIAVGRRVGKKRLWLASMLLAAAAFGAFFAVTEPGPLIWFLAFAIGASGGIGAVAAPAIKADVIDYDEYLTDERKEGAYLAVWNLVRKGSASVTAFVTGWVLQAAGFEPNVEQTESVKLALRATYSLLPASCYLIGALLFLRFRFNEREHAEVRAAVSQRRSGRDST